MIATASGGSGTTKLASSSAPPRTDPSSQSSPTRVQRRRLKAKDVRYIVFEGGGGKGAAYLGALRGLQEAGALPYVKAPQTSGTSTTNKPEQQWRLDFRRIKGIGGASAGAITALLVSIGYTPDELKALMSDSSKFLAFYDGFNGTDPNGKAVDRRRPIYGKSEQVKDEGSEPQWKRRLSSVARNPSTSMAAGLDVIVSASAVCLPLLALVLQVGELLNELTRALEAHKKQEPFKTLLANWPEILVNSRRDMGLFAGAAARDLFDSLLAQRLPLGQDGKPQQNATFQQHYDVFQVELLVTGTNLQTGKSQVFSVRDTPNFSVADAVRISMSVPFVFKPVVIDKDPSGSRMEGVWVDGGLLNNLPFREFDDRDGNDPKNPTTLAIRLDVEPATKPPLLMSDFVKAYLLLGLLGPGEAFITASHAFQTIVLDTKGLSLLNFAPDEKLVERVNSASKATTLNYFRVDPSKPSWPSWTVPAPGPARVGKTQG